MGLSVNFINMYTCNDNISYYRQFDKLINIIGYFINCI